jgi:hypothetical protein
MFVAVKFEEKNATHVSRSIYDISGTSVTNNSLYS